MIPVIDVFAGPGGLGEGFSAYRNSAGQQVFKIALSIEKDTDAHNTLWLRSFYRQFLKNQHPEEYYDCLRGKLAIQDLYKKFPKQAADAANEAWQAELGSKNFPADTVDERIRAALHGEGNWVLIGGPPCQAYSLVGRSRMIPKDPEKYEKDHRHFLYREYLRIIAAHRPPVFVMENVKGILSSQVDGARIIDRILADLQKPLEALPQLKRAQLPDSEYGTARTQPIMEKLSSATARRRRLPISCTVRSTGYLNHVTGSSSSEFARILLGHRASCASKRSA